MVPSSLLNSATSVRSSSSCHRNVFFQVSLLFARTTECRILLLFVQHTQSYKLSEAREISVTKFSTPIPGYPPIHFRTQQPHAQSPSMMSFPQQQGFATRALLEQTQKLSSSLSDAPIHDTEKRGAAMMLRSIINPPSPASMKRSRALSGSFDMSDFLKVSQQVEDSIAFPSIEWPSLGDDSEDEGDNESVDEFYPSSRPSKRHCRGLVRCNRSSNLSSLVDMASRHASERRGSSGSLS